MNKRLFRKLQTMVPLSREQVRYLAHQGAYYPEPRVKDMDLQGIDQVLIVPTAVLNHLPYIQSTADARAFARTYNNWLQDYCSANPERLFGAGLLPLQNTVDTIEELRRVADMKFPVALVRPFDAQGTYPNRLDADPTSFKGMTPSHMDPVFKTFEETQVVLGMHTFPIYGYEPRTYQDSPGELLWKSAQGPARIVDGQALGFIFEAMTWLSQVLLSGFLDRYPKLKMGIFESNATWLPMLLERCDRLFKLYRNERHPKAERTPSEAFYDQCILAFEGDETPVFRRWDVYENIGVWSSDCYHLDAADGWTSIRTMEDAEVPHDVQAKLMGGNAARAYGVEAKLFTTEEPESIPRPDWFPKEDASFERWWDEQVHPRKYGSTRATHGDIVQRSY